MSFLKAFLTFWDKSWRRMNDYEKIACFSLFPISFVIGCLIRYLFL